MDKTPLSKRPTIQLEKEESMTPRSSHQVAFPKSVSLDINGMNAPRKNLSKKLSSAGKTTSLTSKPILAGRAPSLTTRAGKESVTRKTSMTGSSTKKQDPCVKTLWYLRSSYVTVRNDEGGWFLCRLQTNVYNTTKSVKIRWLSPKKERASMDGNDYGLDYRDEIDPACILFNVRVTRDRSTHTLYDEDRLETEKLLKVVTDVASGKLTSEDVDSDVEEVVQIEPPAKKRKIEGKKKSDDQKKNSNHKTNKGSRDKKISVGKERRKAMDKKKEDKQPKRKIAKQTDDLTLHPNPQVKVLEKDPFFETNQSVPFVSKYSHSRLVFRAVHMKDYKLLKKLCKDKEKVGQLSVWRSVADHTTALHHAISLNDWKAIEILMMDYYSGNEERLQTRPDKIIVAKLDTGTYNARSLGVSHIRPLMASRGSREGNNALIKDLPDMQDVFELEWMQGGLIDHILTSGLDFETLKEIFRDDLNEEEIDCYCDYFHALGRIDLALERGHYKLAGLYMKSIHTLSEGCRKFTKLHYDVLISDTELKKAPPAQVYRGSKAACLMTPVHCAACNPNTQHLEKLLEVEPDVTMADRKNRRPIHFAAACEDTGPMELLLSDKHFANMFDADRRGNLPIHYAVQAKRVKNVQYLIDAGRDEEIVSLDDPYKGKMGVAGINRPNKKSFMPLHLAAKNGCLDVVKVLVNTGAIVNATLNSTNFKVTPLMLAAQYGFFDIAVFLVDNGAVVQQRDRLGRTAVIHAAMNGNTNVLSYLLNIGASPKLCDTSGNSPLHYAAAYGWYFCVQTLLEAGADVNVSNDWKTTPLSIAYLKGHIGIVTLLLTDSDVDVNFQDDEGLTLVSIASSSDLNPDLYDQIYLLIKDKGANCTFKDVNDATPLHHLTRNSILLAGTHQFPMPSEEAMETSVKIARLLINHGCDPRAVDKNGVTAVMEAMRTGNVELVKYLVETGCPVGTNLDKDGDNILHHLCDNHMDTMKDYLAILKYVSKVDGKSGTQNLKKDFCDMAKVYCHHGSTPLLAACYQYRNCRKTQHGTESDARLFWTRGRDFIKFLIDVLDSDVDATTQERFYKNEADKPEKEVDRYQIPDVAKWSVAELLAITDQCEYGGLREEDEPESPALRMILKYKPNMNTQDYEGHTPLTRALEAGKIVPVKILVNESNVDIRDSSTCLAASAAQTGKPELLDVIVSAGADVNIADKRYGTKPLHWAIYGGDKADGSVKMIETLLGYAADVNSLSKDKESALHIAVSINTGKMDDNFDVILALISAGADRTIPDKDHRLPLHYVFITIGTLRIQESRYGWTPQTNQHDPVELCRIIASGMKPDDLNIQDRFGMTALHNAAFKGASISCMYLIEKGADVNLKDADGNTALSLALRGRKEGCAAILIQNGASVKDLVFDPDNKLQRPDVTETECETERLPVAWKWAPLRVTEATITDRGISVLEFAVRNEFQAVCFLVMEKPVRESGITFADAIEIGLKLGKYNIVLRLVTTTADVSGTLNKDCEHGRNLLHVLSLTATNFDSDIEKVVTELVEKGVSLTQQDDFKCTPLLYASLNQNFELCKLYMKTPKVYNPKYTDSFHRSVFSAAFWKQCQKIDIDHTWWVHDLHKKANLNELIDRPIQECLFGKSESADPDYWRWYTVKVSPLIIAINHQCLSFTQWFLKKGASVNLPDSLGRTPMMHAVRLNDLDFVKTLMNFNYDPNATEDRVVEKETKMKAVKSKTKLQSRVFKLKRNASTLSKGEEEDGSEEEEERETEDEHDEEAEEEALNPYKKVSNVNLKAADRNGWTVLHHAVCPLSMGTFDNHEIVFILAKAGAKLNVKNKKGETPLDMAVKKGAFRIARIIQELQNIPENKRREPTYSSVDVNDNMKWKNPRPSFHEDAERFLDTLEKPMDVEEEYKAKIDSNCNVTNGTLVKNEDQDRLYDVLLTKVDVNKGVWGLYNFYQMQLVHQPGKDLYILFTRWGRIGDNGQYQHTPYQAKEDGVKEFCKIFLAKTANSWTNIKSFEKKPMKYQLVDNTERGRGPIQPDIEVESKSSVKSRLPPHLQKVMKEMTSMRCLRDAMNKKQIDSEVMPFGRIQRDRLLKARSILDKTSVLLGDVQEYRTMVKPNIEANEETAELKEKYQKICELVGVLSSEYFQVIPQKGYSFDKIRPLDCVNQLEKQIKLVSNLLDYEVASRMLLGAKYREKDMNPLDYVYQSLGCQIQLLEEDDEESQYILKYISSTASAKTAVEAIYRLEVEGEQARMDKKNLGNHRLLWHGMDTAACLSILHRGLVITSGTSSKSQQTGQGRSFTDRFSSCQYESRWCEVSSDPHFILLCEVALGKQMKTLTFEKLKKGHDSVFVMGQNVPAQLHDVRLQTGCLIPLGECKNTVLYRSTYIPNSFNSFIVFDESQVCLRYLVQYRA